MDEIVQQAAGIPPAPALPSVAAATAGVKEDAGVVDGQEISRLMLTSGRQPESSERLRKNRMRHTNACQYQHMSFLQHLGTQ